MPEISRFYGIVVSMYFGDHPVPHVHVSYSGWRAKLAIDTLAVLKGSIPPRALRLAGEWIDLHRDDLHENWRLCEQRLAPARIAPLE